MSSIWLEKNVAEYTLKSADITTLITTQVNSDTLGIPLSKLAGIVATSTEVEGKTIVQGFQKEINVTDYNLDLITSVNAHYISAVFINLIVPKGAYANLATAQTALAGTKIFYQLAVPQLINLTALGKADGELSSFANGTSILDADTFHVPSVQFSVPSNTGSQISSLLESANAQAKQLEAKAPLANPVFTGTQTLPNIVTNGIKFPATQVPSADPNTLDDYEEGTWIPVLTNATSGSQYTITSAIGYYTKIGRWVNATAFFYVTDVPSSGIYPICNAPFTPSDNAQGKIIGTFAFGVSSFCVGYQSGYIQKQDSSYYFIANGTDNRNFASTVRANDYVTVSYSYEV